MPDIASLKEHGYDRILDAAKFEIWHNPEKDRMYYPITAPPSREDVDKAFVTAASAFEGPVDLITDHRGMPSIDTAQPHQLSACFDRLFDLLEIGNVVRVCTSDEGCGICIPMEARLSIEEKGSLVGRTASFEDSDRLLDEQRDPTRPSCMNGT